MKEVITNIDKRYELGLEHHPKSIELYEFIADLDFKNGDVFDFKSGGDGDNGEDLMYLLDVYFETQETTYICCFCKIACNLVEGRTRTFECPKCHEMWHVKASKEECERLVKIVKDSLSNT